MNLLWSSTIKIKYFEPIFDNIGEFQIFMYIRSNACFPKIWLEWKESLCAFAKEHIVQRSLLLFKQALISDYAITFWIITFDRYIILFFRTLEVTTP